MRKLLLLGASGNIGCQSLDIVAKNPSLFELVGISVGNNVKVVPSIVERFPSISSVCVKNEEDVFDLKTLFPQLTFYHGNDGLLSLISESNADMVENALVGFVGLEPSLATLRMNKILCLANKESLVVGGELINKILSSGLGTLYPIDSEHVALAKCLSKCKREDVKRLIITGSGGAFRNLSRKECSAVTPEAALKHPTWNMGPKITIDCATMMNKGFEVIEAFYLFNFPLNQIDIVLHDESMVHSAIELNDGTFIADVGVPDMHGPISYALFEGQLPFEVQKGKSLEDFGSFHFRTFTPDRYPAVRICLDSLKNGGTAPAVLNAANEVAVNAFLQGKIPFLKIEKICCFVLSRIPNIMTPSLRQILTADSYARILAERYISEVNSHA